ncbi:DNA gyrase inhibitor YacG [Alkalilacustris brevis]|uniref:DNA gyrase inhibitor YacG n=1 Tax=Alkalilacustris brevis TaxID=2026338 RepID=UPI000E0D774C|nr:DNA gyrase inhibitor YacG [Alkalilacustris brevis]
MHCPICNRETDRKYRPFCSRRCADVDLGRWFSGKYAIPGEEIGSEAEDEEQSPAPPAPRH